MAGADDGFDLVADELYALPAAGFKLARDAAARRAKAGRQPELGRRIAALRRPTAAAWAVNQLAHRHRGRLQELLDLGADLRRAQDRADAEALRRLTGRRQAAIASLLDLAAGAAEQVGRRLSDQGLQDVEQTLVAALATQDAADQVGTGRLANALTPPTALPDLAPLLHAVPGPGPASAGGSSASRPAPPETKTETGTGAETGSRTRRETGTGAAPDHEGAAEQRARHLEQLRAQRDRLASAAALARRAAAEAEGEVESLAERVRVMAREAERAKAAWEAARFAERGARQAERAARTGLSGLRRRAEQARRRAEEADAHLTGVTRAAVRHP
ncbi:hypothetical protein GCM10009665_08730 [Kitasatospora nipponensis]|uniref:Transposase n=1 Tax=Kitasatospora nipponensis TaxID=258049 RepID=A0ABP4GCG4_9ACTN